ncbi:hypothetical protein ACIRPQ_02390 [Streptomyces sp. NPDC101213]|uniref:hypothetical protein n=1 Tax=Streptomyces sp. NPDC101213 TaxID=3366130 RepID=UPI003829FA3E
MSGTVLLRRWVLGVGQTVWVLALVVLGCLASLATDTFLLLGPYVSGYGCSTADGTADGSQALLRVSEYQRRVCVWQRELGGPVPGAADRSAVPLTRVVDVRETEKGSARVRLSVAVPSDSTFATKVRNGEAADEVQPFVDAVWGVPLFSGHWPEWNVPEYSLTPAHRRAEIVVTGRVPVRPGTVTLFSEGPTTMRMTLPSLRFRAVETTWRVTAQGPDSLSARTGGQGGSVRVTVVPAGSAVSQAGYPGDSLVMQWWPRIDRYAGWVENILAAGWWALLSAAGWWALLLAHRDHRLDCLDTGGQPGRLVRVVGAVLLAHVTVLVAPWISVPEQVVRTTTSPHFRDSWHRLLGWDVMGFPPVFGSVVLMTAASLVVLPRTVRALARDTAWTGGGGGGASAPGRRTFRWAAPPLLCAAALVAAGVALSQLAGYQQRYARDGNGEAGFVAYLMPALLFAVLAVLSAAGAFVARRAKWHLRLSSLLWVSAWTPVLAVAAVIHGEGGMLPVVVRWSGPLVAGAFAVLATGWVAWWGAARSRPDAKALFLVFPIAAALAVPWNRDGTAAPGWWDLIGLTRNLDALLGLVALAAAVRALQVLGRAPVTAPGVLRGHRTLGMVLTFTMATHGFLLLNRPSPVVVVASAVAVWFVFPHEQIRRAAVVLGQNTRERGSAVLASVRSGAARRALPTLRKAARERIAEGTKPYEAAQGRLRTVERMSFAAGPARGRDDVTTRELAFGAFVGGTPWKRGLRAAGPAALIGSPWTLLSLAGGTLRTSAAHASHPVLSLLADVVPSLLTWAGFGLLYGFFLPLLRGRTGLAKALWMCGAMVVPAALQTVTSRDPAHWASWTGTLLYAFQALAFTMTLGFWADASVLGENRMRPARLVDIHNLGFITAWWSSVAVALATGVGAMIVAGVQPFLLDVFPHAPHAPVPSATTPPNPR